MNTIKGIKITMFWTCFIIALTSGITLFVLGPLLAVGKALAGWGLAFFIIEVISLIIAQSIELSKQKPYNQSLEVE